MRLVLAVMRREWWVNTRAYRLSFFGATLLTALFTLVAGRVLYVSVFGGRVTPAFVAWTGTTDYMTWLTVGVVAYAFAHRLLYPSRDVLEEHQSGTLTARALTGVPALTFHVGCVSFSACYALVEAGIILLAALPWCGAALGDVHAGSLGLSLAAGFVGLLGFSTLLAGFSLAVRDRLVVESVGFALMALLGGVAFPASSLPAPLRALGEALPLTPLLRMLRDAALHGAGPADLLSDAARLLLIGAGHAVAGLALLSVSIRRSLAVST
jgi:ABC-2 type transport system permease protein